MAQENQDPGSSRELGEQFKFIAEVTEVIPAENFEESSDKVNLISTAGRFGIIFIACGSGIKVFKTKNVIDNHEKVPVSIIRCRGPITHVSTSCDGLTLFVVAVVNKCPFGIFYDVRHVLQMGKDVVPFYSVPLNTNVESRVVSLSWNPCDPSCIALAVSTGDLSLIKIKETSVEFTNKNGLGANAVTWSAKGKQLAVGMKDATMSLFKPDLTLVRSVPAPAVQDIGPIFDITWFTNTEFFIGYLTMNVGPDLMYVNAPKGKTATFVNFDDVCYSVESDRPISYYSVFISEWNLLFVFSSTGEEMAIIGKTETEGDQFSWCLWSPDEGGKAVMHHYNVVEETFPMGLVVDYTSERRFSSKDETTKGPFPALATISTKGELNVFFVENNLANCPTLNVPSESLPLSGHRTPEQFGQPVSIEQPPVVSETPPSELKQNFLSAFSSIPKKTEISSVPTPLHFSTPVKSTFPGSSLQASKSVTQSFPVTSSASTFALPSSAPTFPMPYPNLFSSTSASTSTANMLSFSSSLISKPVSLSNQIGTTSLPLPAPSPQKSEIFQPLPSPSSNSLFQPKPVVSVPQLTPPLPSPKISKESISYHIQREEQLFEKEMQELRSSIDLMESEIGKDKDLDLKVCAEKIKDWMKAMESTTQDQSDEVSCLHHKTMEALAMYEDANSHRQMKYSSRNEIYNQLRPLDPYSQRKLDEVRFKYRYLMSQMSDVNTKLDLQWEEITALRKPKRDQRSSTEHLYRSVLNLHTMRVSLEKDMEKAIHQLKKLNISPVFSSSSFDFGVDSRSDKLRDILNDSSSGIYPSSPSQAKYSSERNRQLKEILALRNHTPVRVYSVDASFEAGEHKENFKPENTDKSKQFTPPVNKFQNRPEYNISPPINRPQKANPLAALSSLVGKVSTSQTQVSFNGAAVSATSKADASSVGSFGFLQSNKQSLPAFQTNIKQEVSPSSSTGSLFGSSTSQIPLSNQQISSISTGLFTGSKGTTIQGFGSASQAGTLSSSSVSAGAISSGSKSPLLDILTMNKSTSENSSGPTTNFAQFFKGVPPVTVSTTSVIPQFFNPVGSSIDSKVLKDSISSSQNLGTSLGGLATVSSSTVPKFSTSEIANSATAGVKVSSSPKETNVLCANPILSSHILKETSSIASSGTMQGNILGSLGISSSLFSQGLKSVTKDSTSSTSVFSITNTNTPNSQSSLPFSQSISTVSTCAPTTGNSISIFSKPMSSTSTVDQPTTSTSIFSLPTSSVSIFAQPTSSTSVFNQPTTNTSIVGQPITSTSIFGQSITGSSVFGLSTQNVSTAMPQFGSKPVVSTSGSNLSATTVTTITTTNISDSVLASVQSSANSLLFPQSNTNNTNNIFGGQIAPTSSSNNEQALASSLASTSITSGETTVADGSSISISKVPSIFSNATSSMFGKSNGSIFSTAGQTAVTSTSASESNKPILGQSSANSESKEKSTTSSLFTTVVSTSSVSGNNVSGSSSIFGKPLENRTSVGDISSTPSVSTSSSLLSFLITQDDKNTSSVGQDGAAIPSFGFGGTPTNASQSIFGGGGSTVSTANTFGTAATATISSSQSIFGGAPASSTPSVFGDKPSETSQPSISSAFGTSINQSIFGGGNTSVQQSSFGSAPSFGQTNTSVSPSLSTPISTGSIFGGQGPSVFGQAPQNNTIFGNSEAQSTTAGANIFGGSNSSSTTSSIFGATSNSSLLSQGFGQNAGNSTPFLSDNMFSGLGSAPNEENSSKNVFGAVKSEIPSQTNIFGGAGSGSPFVSISSQNPTGAFSPVKSGPTFGGTSIFGGSSLGDVNNPKSVFGGGATFGGNPSFGSSPVLGSGSTSVFGSNANFGSGNTSAGVFGNTPSSGGSTFGSLANQPGSESTGFGQLSQQAGTTGMGNTGSTFGGSSFTGWR